MGGASRPAARRAARLGLPFLPSAHLPELTAYYHRRCAEHGHEGRVMQPPAATALLHVAEDPDRAWERYGEHFLCEARTYAGRRAGAGPHSAVRSQATDVAALRREGGYRVLTPEECVAYAGKAEASDSLILHPLCGGMPVGEGWRSLRPFAERVLPRPAE